MLAHNVATLLRSPLGTTRDVTIDDAEPRFGPELSVIIPVQGRARFLRTQSGVLVQGDVATTIEVECSRCLTVFPVDISAHVEEEFIPSTNVLTGEPLAPPDDEALRIDDRHILDLTETARQYLVTALPLQPVCRADCRGLCPSCGIDLNLSTCGCREDVSASPFAVLTSLLPSGTSPRQRSSSR
jgi:uncharacterized protein